MTFDDFVIREPQTRPADLLSRTTDPAARDQLGRLADLRPRSARISLT
jgi:hypothetical protein